MNDSGFRLRPWLLFLLCVVPSFAAEEKEAVEQRIRKDIEFLASDTLEGRGIDTPGISKAADYIADRFNEVGLKSGVADESYFQPFTVRVSSTVVAEETELTLRPVGGSESVRLVLGKDFQPLTQGGAAKFQGQIIFVGYGITTDDVATDTKAAAGGPREQLGKAMKQLSNAIAAKPPIGYDDYAKIDVAGKVVLVMRREPQQSNPNSLFAGTELTEYAGIASKVQNAWMHKAVAVLLVNDPFNTPRPEDDKLVPANYLGTQHGLPLPVAQITMAAANRLLEGKFAGGLREAEGAIDATFGPMSRSLAWDAIGKYNFKSVEVNLANVVGVLEGEGPNANESIVIGAHYDHLGYGGEGSLADKGTREIHNGADDNASGTATLLELARRFASSSTKPSRRLIFIAFSAEERGLFGSRHYVKKEPIFPLDQTVAMVNFDMVGRMKEEKLILYGTKTAAEFEPLVDRLNATHKLQLKKIGGGSGPSDHASFYEAKMPVFHFFTGSHSDYHKPSDDIDKINFDGMRRIVDYSEELVRAVLALSPKPAYVKTKEDDPHAGVSMSDSKMAYLGSIPDYGEESEGVLLNGVKDGSPAEKGGLKEGDIIIEFAANPIKNVTALTLALQKHKPGETVDIVVLRNKTERVTLKVTLGKR